MGRMHSIPLASLALAAATDTDAFELGTSASCIAYLHEVRLESNVTTDERLHWRILRATTGGDGTAATEVPLDAGNTVTAGVTAKTMAATPGTDGAVIMAGCWSQLAPLHLLWTPETRIQIPISSFLVLNIVTAPAAERTISGFVTWEEC